MQVVDYATRNFSLQGRRPRVQWVAFSLLTGIRFLHVLGGLAAMVFMYLRSLNPRDPASAGTGAHRTSKCCLTTGTS